MKSETWARAAGTGLGVIGGFILGYALVRSAGIARDGWVIMSLTTLEGFIFAYLGTPYVMGGWRRFNLRLTATPLADLFSGLLGMVVGLVIAVLIGYFVREFPYGVGLSAVLALLLALLGASVGLTRRSELLALFGLSHPAVHARRLRGALLDTSVIIDGRVLDLVRSGFLDLPLLVTHSVLKELQYVADSADATRRNRGRRGLDILAELQKEPLAAMEVIDDVAQTETEIDSRLIRTAKAGGWAIMTNDFNLNRVARAQGVTVLNLNELANALKPIAIPGEELTVALVKEGKEPGQGVGYLDDGTMVVVENGRRFLNQTITATVTSIMQTAAGRMIFAAPAGPNGRKRR